MSESKSNIGLSGLLLSVVAVGAVLYVLSNIVIPFVLAGFLSILFRPLVTALNKRNIPTWVALIIVLIVTGSSVYALSMVVQASVTKAIVLAPDYALHTEHLAQQIDSWLKANAGSYYDPKSLSMLTDQVSPERAINLATTWLGSALGVLSDGALILLYLVFMILASTAFPKKLQRAFAEQQTIDMMQVYKAVNDKVLHYLRLKTLINAATGLAVFAVLKAFGVDFAALFGLLAFFLNYLPNIGSILSTLLPGALSLLQFESFGYALVIILTLVVVQAIIGSGIEPKLMGSSLNLSPVAVLFFLVFWGWMWGIVGMVLSVPILAIMVSVMEQFPTTRPLAVMLSGETQPKKAPSPPTA